MKNIPVWGTCPQTFTLNISRTGTGSSAAWVVSGQDRSGQISGVSNGNITIELGDTLILDREQDGVVGDRPYINNQSFSQQPEMTADVNGVTVTASTVIFKPVSLGTYYIRHNQSANAEATITVNQ